MQVDTNFNKGEASSTSDSRLKSYFYNFKYDDWKIQFMRIYKLQIRLTRLQEDIIKYTKHLFETQQTEFRLEAQIKGDYLVS